MTFRSPFLPLLQGLSLFFFKSVAIAGIYVFVYIPKYKLLSPYIIVYAVSRDCCLYADFIFMDESGTFDCVSSGHLPFSI